MTPILKAGGVWLAIAMIVWLTTIWRWQSTGHDASHADIVGQLFLLPLLLAGALLAALWGVKRLKDKAATPVVLPGVAVPVVLPVDVPAGAVHADALAADKAERQVSAWVLAEAVHLSVGYDSGGAWAALRGRASRPTPDAELQDLDGLPVMAARVVDLDLDAWQAGLGREMAEGGQALSLAVQRSLALLEAPLQQLLLVIGELVPEADPVGALSTPSEGRPDVQMKAHLSGVGTSVSHAASRAREAMAPQLTVRVLLPAHWPETERQAALACLRRQCGALSDWAEAARARGVVWRTETLERPEQFWDELDGIQVQWSRAPRPELLLVLAVDSALAPDRIAHMQSLGELFTPAHQSGRMPGEAAVGLLLASSQWPGVAARGDQLPHLPMRMWRPCRARRDKSADAAGRVGTTALQAAITQAATLCAADKDQTVVVADADHRASRNAELFEALQEAMPGIDPMVSSACVGQSCGELGMAGAIVPTALACAALRAGDPPAEHALAIHLQSSHDRVVVALAPWRQPAAAQG